MVKKNIYLLLIILLQIVIFSAPHILGVIYQNDDYVFTGQFGPANENNDTQCANCFYLTQGFKQSFDGAWVIEDKFQGYDTQPKILHMWWILGGHISRILGIDVITFNLLQRLLWIVLGSIVVFNLSKSLFKETIYAVFALLFFSFSCYLTAYTPEGSVFVAYFAAVVLPLAYLILAATFFLLYKYLNDIPISRFLFSLVVFELAFSYPYAMVTLTVSTSIFFAYLYLTHQKKLKELIQLFLVIFIPALLVIAYDYYLVHTDPRLVGSQAHVYSDSLKKLLIGYLPFTFFAALFAMKLYFKNASKAYKNFWIFLYIFSISSFSFTQIPTDYLPFSMQMIVGVQLPLILMTLEYIRLYVYPKTKVILMTLVIIGTVLPNIKMYQEFTDTIVHHKIPSYVESEIYDGLYWLDQNASKHSQLLCMPHWASYAGIFTGMRLYCGGDKLFTPDYDDRQARLKEVMQEDSDNQLISFLKEERIDYILLDDRMKSIDTHQHLSTDKFKVVYDNGKVQVVFFDWSL